MDFGANKMPFEVIKEGAFKGTYFRDIYSGVIGKQYRKSRKEFDQLKNIDQTFFGEQKDPPSSFSPLTSTNVGISTQNFLTFSFNRFATLL